MKSNQFYKNETERNYSPLSELGTLNYIDDPKRVTDMFLSGQIMDRSRRKVPRSDPQIEIVTYLIQDNIERNIMSIIISIHLVTIKLART